MFYFPEVPRLERPELIVEPSAPSVYSSRKIDGSIIASVQSPRNANHQVSGLQVIDQNNNSLQR